MNVVNFSGGRTSAYMTKRLIDEGLENYIVVFQNTGKEMNETLDFVHEFEINFGIKIHWVEYRFGRNFEVVNYETASRNGRPFDELIQYNKGFLPNVRMRYCTQQLKIATNRRFIQSLGIKEWTIYNGIRYDEPLRWSKIKNIDLPNYVDIELPLVKWKTTKQDVLNFWKNQSFDLRLNEPFGNCDGCFLKGVNKLIEISKHDSSILDWWANHEKHGTFKKNISYKKIQEISKSKIGLFDDDPSFDCFCNID